MKGRIKKDIEKYQKENKRIGELAKKDFKKYKKEIYGETDKEKDPEE